MTAAEVCTAPSCICNAKPVTPAAVRAAEEERWFDDVCEDIEEYLHWLGEHNAASRSEQDALAVKVHEAKRAVIDRFYQGPAQVAS